MRALEIKEKNRLKEAIELQRKDCDKEALLILWDLEKKNPENGKVLGFLGLVLAKTKKHKEAIPYLLKALKSNPQNELLNLSLYNCYIAIEEYKMATDRLFDYLEKYPADLFKDTLEELLEGLLEDYGTTYRDKIIFYAKKNDINIPEELDNG